MILSRTPQTAADVAGHYDELDGVYRALWGNHVHHGLWRSGRETPDAATDALSDLVADRLELTPGMAVVDIGCGYGATAARLAARRGVAVTGFTVSAEQAARAPAGITVHHRDWLDNGLADASFDRAYAIESSEHMVDKPRFFAEAARVLRPGGRLVVCAWLAREAPGRWETDHLLEPICREGRLPSMGSASEYRAMAEGAGLDVLGFEDISEQVRRTWTICARRFAGAFFTDPATRRLALKARNRSFALSVPRLMLAYRTGAMRYGVFVFGKA